MRLEDKLANLAKGGIHLRPELTPDALLVHWDREAYEEPGYELLLVALGTEQEETPDVLHSDNVWHFDSECIDDEQGYALIAKRLSVMAGGSLPLTDVDSDLDFDEGEAWLEFRCGGEEVHLDFAVDDDWVDTSVFSEFVRLLARRDPNKLFFVYPLGGQDAILGCVTQAQFRELRHIAPDVQPLE